jgi:hypothetical protein
MTALSDVGSPLGRRSVVEVSPVTGSPFTVAVPIDPKKLDALRELLLEIGHDLEQESVLGLRHLRHVHFLRWVIVPPAREGDRHLLVFGSDHDGTRAEHLAELWHVCGPGLSKIYAHCAGNPTFDGPEALRRFFERHALEKAATYSGTRDRSVEQIRAEDRLQARLADYLDTAAGRQVTAGGAVETLNRIAQTKPEPALEPGRLPPSTESWLSKLLHGALFVPIATLAVVLLLVPAAIFALLIRLRELTERDDDGAHHEPPVAALTTLKSREDRRRLVQNQLTHVVAIKPGWFRMLSLKVVLWSIDFLAKHFYNRGALGGIPSIHYARWMILEDRRLLFFSNFDGSWESYLGDFVDQAAKGLTGVWSNTQGFPRPFLLLWKGARDEESFKNWTRAHQIETQIWYSAYPNLSVQNINDNTKLREGLSSAPEGEALDVWLRTL